MGGVTTEEEVLVGVTTEEGSVRWGDYIGGKCDWAGSQCFEALENDHVFSHEFCGVRREGDPDMCHKVRHLKI